MSDLVLSSSRMSRYNQCGKSYELHYVHQVPQVPRVSTIGGNAFHDWAHDWQLYRMSLRDKPEPFDVYLELRLREQEEKSGLDSSFFKTSGRKTKTSPDGETIDVWRNSLGPSMCDNFKIFNWDGWVVARNLPPDAEGKTIGLEYHLVIDGWQGYMDRIDCKMFGDTLVYRIVDYKTGRLYKTTQNDEYGAALSTTGVRVGYTGTYLARKAELHVTPKRWDALTFLEYQAHARTGIEAGFFAPNVGDHCGWCGVADHCKFRPAR